jgi:outer membrane immunogenic protein
VRLAATVAFGLAFSGHALAADLRRPAPVPADPPTAWGGLYVGAHAGYGWNDAAVSDTFSAPGFGPLGSTTSFMEKLTGGIWGGQIGYNWQFGSLVAGAEADVSGTGQLFNQPYGCDVGGAVVPGCTVHPKDSVRWSATARARLGYAVDRYLFYVTGGGAWQNLGSFGHVTIAGAGGWDIFNTRTTRAGYTIGGGVEAALYGKWSVGLEYLFIDTGTKQTANVVLPAGLGGALGAPPGTSVFETHALTDNIVRLRLNFRP